MRTIEKFFEGRFCGKVLNEPYRRYWKGFWKANMGALAILIIWAFMKSMQFISDFINYVIWGIGG